ncbi:MAG: HXXEE domain-containing protein [Hyphomicrobiales bacterium]|nr:MAG: HXXEE domain-containing protein [Hyphomicrobiales bacterium]
MYETLKLHWVFGAGLMAGALLLLTPLLYDVWPLSLLLLFLHSPGYMIHQVEEHAGDRFRAFVNARLAGGREALSTLDVIWINVGAVWGMNLAALYAGRFVEPGWGLAAPYLMLVNAISHIGSAAKFGGYNPGLATSVAIFLPLSIASLWLIPATPLQHGLGLALAIAVHLAIAVRVMWRAKRLAR